MDNKVYIITGMHRSGTSMIAGILKKTGIYFGEDNELIGPSNWNLKGHFELKEVVDINSKILKHYGWHNWDTAATLPFEWEHYTPLQYDMRIAKLITKFSSYPHFAWKDPRFCFTLPLWLKYTKNIILIVCIRNPLEVAYSLSVRHRFKKSKGLEIWHRYNLSLLNMMYFVPRIVVEFQSFFDEECSGGRKLLNGLGIIPKDEHFSDVDFSLNHHKIDEGELDKHVEIKGIYEWMKSLIK